MNPYNNLPITKYEKVRPRLHFFDYNIHKFYIYVYLDPFKEKYSKYKLPNGEVIEFMYEPVYVGKGTGAGFRLNQHIAEYLKNGQEENKGIKIHNELKRRKFKEIENNMLRYGHGNIDFPREWKEYKKNWIIILGEYGTAQQLEAAERNFIKGIGTQRKGTGPLVNAILG